MSPVLYVMVYTINLAPLTLDSLLEDFAGQRMAGHHLLSSSLIAFAIPFANLLGNKVFFEVLFCSQSRNALFHRHDSWGGLVFMFAWLALTITVLEHGPWGDWIPLVAGVLALLLAPSTIWCDWMRIPLVKEALVHLEFRWEFD